MRKIEETERNVDEKGRARNMKDKEGKEGKGMKNRME